MKENLQEIIIIKLEMTENDLEKEMTETTNLTTRTINTFLLKASMTTNQEMIIEKENTTTMIQASIQEMIENEMITRETPLTKSNNLY